jgi:hypothetical protein
MASATGRTQIAAVMAAMPVMAVLDSGPTHCGLDAL